MIGLLFLPVMLWSGFYVAISQLPKWLQWPAWITPMYTAMRLLLEEELRFCIDQPVSTELPECIPRGAKEACQPTESVPNSIDEILEYIASAEIPECVTHGIQEACRSTEAAVVLSAKFLQALIGQYPYSRCRSYLEDMCIADRRTLYWLTLVSVFVGYRIVGILFFRLHSRKFAHGGTSCCVSRFQ